MVKIEKREIAESFRAVQNIKQEFDIKDQDDDCRVPRQHCHRPRNCKPSHFPLIGYELHKRNDRAGSES